MSQEKLIFAAVLLMPQVDSSTSFPSLERMLRLSSGEGAQSTREMLESSINDPKYNFISPQTGTVFGNLSGLAEKIFSSVIATMRSPLQQFLSPVLAASTNATDIEPEMEKVWQQMLNNDALGLDRPADTLFGLAFRYSDRQLGALAYAKDLGMADAEGTQSWPVSDPNVIGTQSLHYEYDGRSRGWNMVSGTSSPNALAMMSQPETQVRPATDPQTLTKLDDARAVRMERNANVTQIAPGYPYLKLAKSPFVLADSPSQVSTESRLATRRLNGLDQPSHDLYASLKQGLPDASEDRLIQFTAACLSNKITADNLSMIHMDETSMQIIVCAKASTC